MTVHGMTSDALREADRISVDVRGDSVMLSGRDVWLRQAERERSGSVAARVAAGAKHEDLAIGVSAGLERRRAARIELHARKCL